jgi:hypothetical protein
VHSFAFAPRLSPRLLDAIVRLDNRKVPIAETNRRVGAEAARLGLPKPSYQRVRVLVHAARLLRQRRGPSVASLLIDVSANTREPRHVLDYLVAGLGPIAPASETAGLRSGRPP